MSRAIAAGLAMMLAGAAQAAMIASNDSNPLQPTEIMQSLTLDKFDTNLGTLTSASLTLSGDALSSLLLDNDQSTATSPANFAYASGAGLVFSSALGLGIPGSIFTPTIGLTLFSLTPPLAADDGDGPGAQNGGPDEGTFAPSAASDMLVLDVSAFLGALSMAGPGTFGIDCVSFVTQSFSGGGGNVKGSQQTQASCAARITYDFDPAPQVQTAEPGTLALLGLTLAGLAGLRRRNKNA